ncbi:MAG: hypothetical protein JO318_02900, partial [Chloroflexi bacterium]|nr:hypothetical protein [Chloroflexota bacterium]
MADVAIPLDLEREEHESATTRFFRTHASTLRGAFSLLVVAAVWEIAGRTGRWPLILAPISDIWLKFLQLAASGELLRHVLVSLNEFIVGFAMAAVFGVVLGIVIASSQTAK